MDTKTSNSVAQLIKNIDSFRVEPDFTDEINKRKNRKIPERLSDNEMLKILSELIFFSQNANSKLVEQLLEKKIFNKIFFCYDVHKVATMNPCELVEEFWDSIKSIRQQSKLFHVVMLARKIIQIGSLSKILIESGIPQEIKSNDDIDQFWKKFKELREILDRNKVPFFRSTTSLLHFLLEIGYDCVKPDLVVMKVAKEIGIVDSEKGEKNFIKAVRSIQKYSLEYDIKPSVVDFYFLIHGRQKAAEKYVRKDFYNLCVSQ